jgi:hypothetical protein
LGFGFGNGEAQLSLIALIGQVASLLAAAAAAMAWS